MTTPTTPKPLPTRLGLFITTERDRSYGDYFHIRAHVVTIGATAYERRCIDSGTRIEHVPMNKIRNASGDELYHGLYLDGLRASCQGVGTDNPRQLYGFDVEYRDVFSVDLGKAQRMATTLKTIDKRMDTLRERYGRPASFGQYLARLAAAIKADAFVLQQGTARGWSYDENGHKILSIADGIYTVERMADDWVREEEIAREKAEQEARQREQLEAQS